MRCPYCGSLETLHACKNILKCSCMPKSHSCKGVEIRNYLMSSGMAQLCTSWETWLALVEHFSEEYDKDPFKFKIYTGYK